jgi:hypothetical protein
MKSSIPIRRLRGPAFLILAGILAALDQWDILSFLKSWPLFVILAGAFLLAERAVTREAGPAPGESQGSEGESGFAGPRWGSS